MSEPRWQSWIIDIRARLSDPPPRLLPPSGARSAALLMPLYVDARQLWTLITRRAAKVAGQSGQVAFPGGPLDPEEDPWQAALRHSEEETGIEAKRVMRIGQLDEIETPSGFRIVPVVGAVPNSFETAPKRGVVDEIFAVPLSAFADPRLVEDRWLEKDGRQRLQRLYHIGGRTVGGLTAGIVQNLLVRLGLEPGGESN